MSASAAAQQDEEKAALATSLFFDPAAPPSRNAFLDCFCAVDTAPILVEGLLFLLYNGTLHHKYFSEAQVVMLLLRILVEGDGVVLGRPDVTTTTTKTPTTSPHVFINAGNKTFAKNFLLRRRDKTPYVINAAHLGLPDVPATKDATNADIVLLAMCSLLSEAAPRWYLGLAPSAASVIHAVCGTVAAVAEEAERVTALARSARDRNTSRLPAASADAGSTKGGGAEDPFSALAAVRPLSLGLPGGVALYELRHSLDFTTHANFLRKGDMGAQAAQLMASAVLVLLTGGRLFDESALFTAVNRKRRSNNINNNNNNNCGSQSSAALPIHPLASVNPFSGGRGGGTGTGRALQLLPSAYTLRKKGSTSCSSSSQSNDGSVCGGAGGVGDGFPIAFPSLWYISAVAPLAAAVGGSEAPTNLLAGWYGINTVSGRAVPSSSSAFGVDLSDRSTAKTVHTSSQNNNNNNSDHFVPPLFFEGEGEADGRVSALRLPMLCNNTTDNDDNAANSSRPRLTPAQRAIISSSLSLVASLYVLLNKALRGPVEAAIAGVAGSFIYSDDEGAEGSADKVGGQRTAAIATTSSSSASSSTAGRNDIVVDANKIRLAFGAAVRSLAELFLRSSCPAAPFVKEEQEEEERAHTREGATELEQHQHQQKRGDVADGDDTQGKKRSTAPAAVATTSPYPYANLLAAPVALWISKACWAITQQHNMGPPNTSPPKATTSLAGAASAVLFDARSAYMFLGSRRFYGEKVSEKIAKGKGLLSV